MNVFVRISAVPRPRPVGSSPAEAAAKILCIESRIPASNLLQRSSRDNRWARRVEVIRKSARRIALDADSLAQVMRKPRFERGAIGMKFLAIAEHKCLIVAALSDSDDKFIATHLA